MGGRGRGRMGKGEDGGREGEDGGREGEDGGGRGGGGGRRSHLHVVEHKFSGKAASALRCHNCLIQLRLEWETPPPEKYPCVQMLLNVTYVIDTDATVG